MPPAAKKLWTTSRKLVGNVLPLVLSGPVFAVGIVAVVRERPLAESAGWSALFLATAWLATNLLGPAGNQSMKAEMLKRLQLAMPFCKEAKWFVGSARPNHKSLLDPHEDVGFLVLQPDSLLFFGSDGKAVVPRTQAKKIARKANPHSWLGLGGFVTVETEAGPLYFEARERLTLLGNRSENSRLKAALDSWLAAAPEKPKSTDRITGYPTDEPTPAPGVQDEPNTT